MLGAIPLSWYLWNLCLNKEINSHLWRIWSSTVVLYLELFRNILPNKLQSLSSFRLTSLLTLKELIIFQTIILAQNVTSALYCCFRREVWWLFPWNIQPVTKTLSSANVALHSSLKISSCTLRTNLNVSLCKVYFTAVFFFSFMSESMFLIFCFFSQFTSATPSSSIFLFVNPLFLFIILLFSNNVLWHC